MRKSRSLIIASLALSSMALFGQLTLAQEAQQSTQPSGQTRAGGKGNRGGGGGMALRKMVESLDLTDDQRTKVKPIFEEQTKQMKAVREDTSLAQDARTAKMKEIRQSTMKKVKEVLTPEQQTKLAEKQKSSKNPS